MIRFVVVLGVLALVAAEEDVMDHPVPDEPDPSVPHAEENVAPFDPADIIKKIDADGTKDL